MLDKFSEPYMLQKRQSFSITTLLQMFIIALTRKATHTEFIYTIYKIKQNTLFLLY